MKEIVILKCAETKNDGDIFMPLAEWNDDSWNEIDDEYRLKKYINTGHVFHYQHRFEKNVIIYAKIIPDEKHFNRENPNHLFYQVLQDFEPRNFAVVAQQTLKDSEIEGTIALQFDDYGAGEKIYFPISDEMAIGPFVIKNEERNWVAQAELKEDIYLDCLNINEIKKSKNCFIFNNNIYFLTNEIKTSDRIILSNAGFFRKILNSMHKLGKFTRKEKQQLFEYFEQNNEFNSLIECALPHTLSHKEKLIKRLKDIITKLQFNELLIKEISELLLVIPEVKKSIEKNVYEKIKNESFAILDKIHKKELQELSFIKSQVEKERQQRDALIEFNEKKRREIGDYIEKGERWKNALMLTSQNDEIKSDTIVLKFDENCEILKSICDFFDLLNKYKFCDDDILNIKNNIKKMIRNRFFQVGDLNEMDLLEQFFNDIGHKNGRIVVYADATWLSPESLLNAKVYLNSSSKNISLSSIFKIAEENKELIIQIEILGANRAPIEGYLGPLIKAADRKEYVIFENKIIKIPENIIFVLQLDDDEYTAKLSQWLNGKLCFWGEFLSLEKLALKIAIPFNVLLEIEKL